MGSSGKIVVAAIVAFAATLAVVAYLGHPNARLRPATVVLTPSIAVLPFDNLDGDAELEVIAADVTRAVVRELQKNREIRVVPHGASLAHKDLAGGAAGVAEALSADYVLAGSVEREPAGLRLQAYFVKPGERPRIWADEFRYAESERGGIPAEIARVVGEALTRSGAPREDPPGSP